MSSNSVVSPFNCLLNSISSNLSHQNLQSLIHVCERYIPESEREEIKNGLDVFRILKYQNVIADDREKIHHLEQIVKVMRPKRKDIIKRVRDFIRTNYDPYHEFLSSGESYVADCEPTAVRAGNHHQPPPLDRHNSSSDHLYPVSAPQRSPPTEVKKSLNIENHCSMDCCCLGCSCYARRIPSCVLLFLTVIMGILTFLSAVFWFEKMPHTLYSKMGPDASKAGGYVVGCFVIATMGLLSWWIYRKVHGNSRVGQIPYQSFKNDNPLNATSYSDAVEKDSFENVKLPVKKQKRRSFGSSRGGSSSLVKASSASALERGHSRRDLLPREQRRSRRKSIPEDGEIQIEFHSKEPWNGVQTN